MTTSRTQVLDAAHAEAYRGTFAPTDPVRVEGDALPPGWEGAFFPFAVPFADLRPDGTPARDGILPEFDLPRRMYAGEDTTFSGDLRLGDVVHQTATAGPVVAKAGSSGRLVFADIEREYAVGGEVRVRSVWHDVFLEAASGPGRPPRSDPRAAAEAVWVEEVRLDARRLFRFSALTFNTHLVHYDRRWAQEVEGLPDLLVHGPLLRILLVDAARRHAPDRRIQALRVRVTAPAFVDSTIRLCGADDGSRVVALGPHDVVLATADVVFG